MTIETELRAALHERAARIRATPRLLTADYRPRTRRLSPRAAGAGGAAIAAAITLGIASKKRSFACCACAA